MSKSLTTDLRCRSPVHYQLCNGLLWLMAVWIDRVEKLQLLETFKNKLRHAIRQGAIKLSKSDVDPCSHGRDPDRQKCGRTDRQTDRQTDSFSALYSRLYLSSEKWLLEQTRVSSCFSLLGKLILVLLSV